MTQAEIRWKKNALDKERKETNIRIDKDIEDLQKNICQHPNGDYLNNESETFVCPDCGQKETVPNRGYPTHVQVIAPGKWVDDLFRGH